MTPEGRVKAKLKKDLAERHYYQYWPVPSGYGAVAVDCLVCVDGNFIAIECKREGIRKPTSRQATTMRAMRKAGAHTYVVTLDDDGKLLWLEQTD